MLIDDRQFFDLVLMQAIARLLQRRTNRHGYQAITGHQLSYGTIKPRLKSNIAVGEDADELPMLGDGDAGDVKVLHRGQCLAQQRGRLKRHRIGNHARFRTLDFINLLRLRLNR